MHGARLTSNQSELPYKCYFYTILYHNVTFMYIFIGWLARDMIYSRTDAHADYVTNVVWFMQTNDGPHVQYHVSMTLLNWN